VTSPRRTIWTASAKWDPRRVDITFVRIRLIVAAGPADVAGGEDLHPFIGHALAGMDRNER
jgi:hypothetical protein